MQLNQAANRVGRKTTNPACLSSAATSTSRMSWERMVKHVLSLLFNLCCLAGKGLRLLSGVPP